MFIFNLEVILKFHFLVIHFALPDFRNQRFSLHTFTYLILTQIDLLGSLFLLDLHNVGFS